MGTDKKRKQLLSRLKKREKKGIARPVVVKSLMMKTGERNRFTNKNAMVLLAIEKTIIALADDEVGLDDLCVQSALVSSIRDISSRAMLNGQGNAAVDETSSVIASQDKSAEFDLGKQLAKNLGKRYESFFAANDSQSMEIWADGLRAVYTSASSLSDFEPGEKSYLRSAAQFLAQAARD